MRTILILSSAFCVAAVSLAGVLLQPVPAPEWNVATWLDANPGSLHDLRGRIVLIGRMHLSCAESLEFLIPLFRRWSDLYAERGDVALVLIHQGPAPPRLRDFIHESGISCSTGTGVSGGPTPHVAVVDRRGMLRLALDGTFAPEPIEEFIARLLEEPTETLRSDEARPAGRIRPALDSGLSGPYVFRTEQATGTCATWIPRMEIPAKLRIYRDAIDIEFTRPLFGMDALELRFDADTGRVEGESERVASGESGFPSAGLLRLEGVLESGAEPPVLEFELSVVNADCSIRGQARAEP